MNFADLLYRMGGQTAPAQTLPLPPTPPVQGTVLPQMGPPPTSSTVDFTKPGMMEQFWAAWGMPGEFVGTPTQVQQMQQLSDMQDRNVATTMAPPPAPPAASAPAGEPAAQPGVTKPETPADQFTQRREGWKSIMEKLKDPNVAGPLQTFFAALSAPMGLGENWASRLGRASSLASIHQSMLQENARNRPREEEMRQLEVEGKRLDVQGKQAEVRGREADAAYKESTLEDRVAATKQDYLNALNQGKLSEANLKLKNLQLELEQKYGPQKAELEMKRIRAQIARDNAATNRERVLTTKAQQEGTKEDKVWTRRVNLAKGTVQGFLRQFKSTNPQATVDDFYAWVDAQSYVNPEIAKIHDDVGILMSEGIDPFELLTAPAASAEKAPAVIDAAAIRAAREARQRQVDQAGKSAPTSGGGRTDWPQYR